MKKNYLFWITGLSGSGKSTIAKKIFPEIVKRFGPTIIFSGDDLRNIFNLKYHDIKMRKKYALIYSKFCKILYDQKFNVIFSTVSLFHEVHTSNRKLFKNYLEIYIKSDISKLIKNSNKHFYRKKKLINIVGKNIKAQFPKNPHIIIENNFHKSKNDLKKEIIKKIINKLNR